MGMNHHAMHNPYVRQENLIRNEVLSAPLYQQQSALLASRPVKRIQPTASTVVIGKGRVPKKAPGNKKLRELVQEKVQEYVSAKSKMVKSSIVTDIYFTIESMCQSEGSAPPFVRYDGIGYTKTSESVAREKITSSFRDCLHDKYKSSSKNKVAKRRIANKEKAEKKRKKRLEEQQREFLRREMQLMPPSNPLNQQHQHQQQQQQQQQQAHQQQVQQAQLQLKNSLSNNAFLLANQMPHLSRIGTFNAPLFEFTNTPPVDRGLFEKVPVPVPELDCASAYSSSSASYQSSSTGVDDGY